MLKNKLLFIVGTPRSGTTTVRNILNSHSKLNITPESSYFFRIQHIFKVLLKFKKYQTIANILFLIPSLNSWIGVSKEQIIKILKKKKITKISKFYLLIMKTYGYKKNIILGDKTPKNLLVIDKILKIFPNSKIIFVVRDPRDNILSNIKASFGYNFISSNLFRWKRDYELFLKLSKIYKKNFFLLKFENLVKDPEKEINKILDFLKLNKQKIYLKYLKNFKDDVKHEKSLYHGKYLQKGNRGNWKKVFDQSQINFINSVLHEHIKNLKYEKITSENLNMPLNTVNFYLIRLYDFILRLLDKKKNTNILSLIKIYILFVKCFFTFKKYS